MTDTIPHTILVCGFGRCGSSLMMQMLRAGGVPVTGEWPAFEDNHTSPMVGTIDADWLATVPGAAIKVLDPHRLKIPAGSYRAIWMERDHDEQSRSQAKFARMMMGLPIDRRGVRALAASYRADKPAAIRTLRGAGCSPMPVTFESLLNASMLPDVVAGIARFLDRPLDQQAMIRAVRLRSSRCAPGLDMELRLIEQGPSV